MELQIIQVGTPAYDALIEKTVQATIAICKREFKGNEDKLLTHSEALEMMKVGTDKMKRLRDEKIIVAKKLGKAWRYSRNSIIKWMESE